MFDKLTELVNKVDWVSIIVAVVLVIILYNFRKTINSEFMTADYTNDSLQVASLIIKASTDNIPWTMRQEAGDLVIRRSGTSGTYPNVGTITSDNKMKLTGTGAMVVSYT